MINLEQARKDCLDRIVDAEMDTKVKVKLVSFLVKQLKQTDDPEVFDTLKGKLDETLHELTLPTYVDDSGGFVYPTIELSMQIYEAFSLVIKERENFIRPKETIIQTELSADQLQSLEELDKVMGRYGELNKEG